VSVHSDGPGKGSAFVVRLPLAPAPSTPPALGGEKVPPGIAPHPVSACHILIIEDNADARGMLSLLLQMLGHRTAMAATGPEGVERALADRPQVALIDLGLPGLDGFQVARQLRTALGDSILLIALSGYAQEEDRQRCQEAGFDAHLPKPVELEELNRVLASRK
jgi:CheY-like chemotaxis protein